ncbi:MAG: hypothetical protein V2A73_17745, partial [Pseudomonadota bacterium]
MPSLLVRDGEKGWYGSASGESIRTSARGVIVARWSPVDGGETRASAIPDVDVSRSDGHDKAPEGAQAVLGLWS